MRVPEPFPERNAMVAIKRHHFAGQHWALMIGNNPATTAFLKSSSGGMFKAATTPEQSAGYHLQGKHASVRELEPLTLEFGMSGAMWALEKMQKICETPGAAHEPFDGLIMHADSNFVTQYKYEFTGARITEFSLPKLDVKSKELAHCKIKCQPETINFTIAKDADLDPAPTAKQKEWQCNAFHTMLTLDGEICPQSIEALTVKVGSKIHQVGGFQTPTVQTSGKLEMPTVSMVLPLMHPGTNKVLDWFKNTIFNEKGEVETAKYEQDLIISFLDPSRTRTLYTITLIGVGPSACSFVNPTNESTAAMKFECYVTNIQLETTGPAFTTK